MANPIDKCPEEIVAETLSRLEVKSLLLYKSVSKSWLSIISGPNLIKSHLRRAVVASWSNPTLLIIKNDLNTFNGSGCSRLLRLLHRSTIDDDLLQKRRGKLKELDVPIAPIRVNCLLMPHLLKVYSVIGSCNGIICLDYKSGNCVALWNPTIRQYKKIPAPMRGLSGYKIGFGYDSVSNDYKILRFLYTNRYGDIPIIQLYSTNAGCWTQSQLPILKNEEICCQTTIVVNGVLYFTSKDKLISFDLSKMLVGLVPFPKFIRGRGSEILDFNGSVACVFFDDGPGATLWTLDEVSRKMCWTKKLSLAADNIWLSFYLGAGKFYGNNLIYQTHFLYDYKKKDVKNYSFGKMICAAIKYIETLVSLDGFQQVD